MLRLRSDDRFAIVTAALSMTVVSELCGSQNPLFRHGGTERTQKRAAPGKIGIGGKVVKGKKYTIGCKWLRAWGKYIWERVPWMGLDVI
jgi:hypothetical protein